MKEELLVLFGNVGGDPEILEEVLKIPATRYICLGNLVPKKPDFEEEQELTRAEKAEKELFENNLIECLEIVKESGCTVLKGENEYALADFEEPKIRAYLRELPIAIYRNGFGFFPTLSNFKELDLPLGKRSPRTLKNGELVSLYGHQIRRTLANLLENNVNIDSFFFGGREECVLWEYNSRFPARADSIYEAIESARGTYELDLSKRHSSFLMLPGSLKKGYYCLFRLPEKKLIMFSV